MSAAEDKFDSLSAVEVAVCKLLDDADELAVTEESTYVILEQLGMWHEGAFYLNLGDPLSLAWDSHDCGDGTLIRTKHLYELLSELAFRVLSDADRQALNREADDE